MIGTVNSFRGGNSKCTAAKKAKKNWNAFPRSHTGGQTFLNRIVWTSELFFDSISWNRKADVVQTTEAVPSKSAAEPVQTFSLTNNALWCRGKWNDRFRSGGRGWAAADHRALGGSNEAGVACYVYGWWGRGEEEEGKRGGWGGNGTQS